MMKLSNQEWYPIQYAAAYWKTNNDRFQTQSNVQKLLRKKFFLAGIEC